MIVHLPIANVPPAASTAPGDDVAPARLGEHDRDK
jgi:hypothetical protein